MAWGDGLPMDFALSVDELPIADVVRVAGDLDLSNVAHLEKAFSTLSSDPGRRLVLDFREVTFIDSTTLGLLVKESRRRSQGVVSILIDNPELRRIFEITGLERHFDLSVNATGATV
jgi:anti-anti-sigma factor